jgi:hypothetical protein
MLTIRTEQVEAFRQHHLQKFEDDMVQHLKKFAPRHWKVMGEPDGRRVIRLGIEQARKHGLTNRGPVRFYIELMFMFGSYFDIDPQYPWASTVLANPEAADQSVRADRLYAAMNEYMARVVEPEREHMKMAARRLSDTRFEDLLPAGSNLEDGILQILRELCPTRCKYLGESALKRTIQYGFELATKYEFTSDKGKVLMMTLALSVGHGFADDPLNGWILRRLHKPRWTDPNKQVDELYSKSQIYLKHILAGGDEA